MPTSPTPSWSTPRTLDPGDGQVVLRVDRVGMTANNVTYAVFGDAMQYWDFFPAEPRDGVSYGRVPLWGFADGRGERRARGVAEGTRLFGYLPTSSHLVVEPAGSTPRASATRAPHRQHLPTPYNGLTTTTADPAYDADQEDLQVLYRPLFMTSFVLADFIEDNGCFGADTVVISSASSKTSYGTAFLLDGVHRIGLTSARQPGVHREPRAATTRCVTYDEIADLPPSNGRVRRRGRRRRRSAGRCTSGWRRSTRRSSAPRTTTPRRTSAAKATCPGATPTFFFAPDQMRKRYADWGPDGVEERHAEAWARFAPVVAGWVDVVVGEGPEALRADWLETLAGDTPPRTGHVIQL